MIAFIRCPAPRERVRGVRGSAQRRGCGGNPEGQQQPGQQGGGCRASHWGTGLGLPRASLAFPIPAAANKHGASSKPGSY